jgi:hypothetical protein
MMFSAYVDTRHSLSGESEWGLTWSPPPTTTVGLSWAARRWLIRVTIRGSVPFSAAAVWTSLYDSKVSVVALSVELFVGASAAVGAGAVVSVVLFASDTFAAACGTAP